MSVMSKAYAATQQKQQKQSAGWHKVNSLYQKKINKNQQQRLRRCVAVDCFGKQREQTHQLSFWHFALIALSFKRRRFESSWRWVATNGRAVKKLSKTNNKLFLQFRPISGMVSAICSVAKRQGYTTTQQQQKTMISNVIVWWCEVLNSIMNLCRLSILR